MGDSDDNQDSATADNKKKNTHYENTEQSTNNDDTIQTEVRVGITSMTKAIQWQQWTNNCTDAEEHARTYKPLQHFYAQEWKGPDKDNNKKLARVIQYIGDTQNIALTIKADDNPHWWVNSSYSIHPDMKSHMGVLMLIGKGCTYMASSKQKLNTKSSTEAELVVIDVAMGQILWTRHFLAAQGIHVSTTTIYQDNKSKILLSENGRLSSGKRTWHLNVRYFFLTDKIQKGEVKVTYCPNENMLADFFTKPLQGSAFQKIWDIILNLPSNKNWWSTQECVGRSEKMMGLKIIKMTEIWWLSLAIMKKDGERENGEIRMKIATGSS